MWWIRLLLKPDKLTWQKDRSVLYCSIDLWYIQLAVCRQSRLLTNFERGPYDNWIYGPFRRNFVSIFASAKNIVREKAPTRNIENIRARNWTDHSSSRLRCCYLRTRIIFEINFKRSCALCIRPFLFVLTKVSE